MPNGGAEVSMSGWIGMITAVLSSVGFGIYFRVKPGKLPFAAIGGLLAWGISTAASAAGFRVLFGTFFATAAIVIYSEIMARVLKAPANTVLIPSVISLLPGQWLYYMMKALMSGDLNNAYACGILVVQNVLGIGMGILLAMFFYYQIIRRLIELKKS